MDGKRKLPADPGSDIPDLKKERQTEEEDFNFDITESPNFKTEINFNAPVNMVGGVIDPLAGKSEVNFAEKHLKFEQNPELTQGNLPQATEDEILPVNHDQIKTEEDERLRYVREEYSEGIDPLAVKSEVNFEEENLEFEQDPELTQGNWPQAPEDSINHDEIKTEEDESLTYIKEEYSEANDYPGHSRMKKKDYVLKKDGSVFVLDRATGRLIFVERYKGGEDEPSERSQDFQRSGETQTIPLNGPGVNLLTTVERFGESYQDGRHQDSQPSGSNVGFKFPQPIDQKPCSSELSAEQQFPSLRESLRNKLAESLKCGSSISQSSVSVSMLVDRSFTSGFWTVDQQNGILTQPIPFFEDDRTMKNWLYEYSSYPWLCVANKLMRFFCWPCLLFGNPHNPWSVDSEVLVNSNFRGNNAYLNDHQNTNQHREAELIYITRKNRVHSHLTGEPSLCQEIWKHLVQAICSERKNKFVFENTLEFESKITPMMKYVFLKMMSPTAAFMLSKVISAIATHHMKMKIIEDVQKAQYVVLHIEELSPIVSNGNWLAAIARYADEDGHFHERVIEFIETFPVKVQRSDDVPVAWIKHLFEDYKLNANVIGISYSSTLVGPKDILLFNNRLLKWCPRAMFFHPPAHSFYKSLLQAISHSAFCRKYLRELDSLCKFLNNYSTMFRAAEQSSTSTLPKTFDANFQAKFKSHFPALKKVLQQVESSWAYRPETRKEASKYLKFFSTVVSRILMILIDRICSTVAEIAEAVDGTFYPLRPSEEFQYLVVLQKQSVQNFKNFVTNGIDSIANDELMTEYIPASLRKKYQANIKIIVGHAKEYLLQRFANWDQFRYTDSKLLESSLDSWKSPEAALMKQLDLDEPELIQLKFFLDPCGGAPLTENKSLAEIFTCLARGKSRHEFPGLFKFLLFVHTTACDKRTFGNLLNSVYNFTEIKSPGDITKAYLDGYFWQVEDISAVMDDKFYQKAYEACQSKVAKM